MYYRARYYSPAIGRFISEDPLRLEMADTDKPDAFQAVMTMPLIERAYPYASNDPVARTDPLGLSPTSRIPVPSNCQLALQKCREITQKCKDRVTCIYNKYPDQFPDWFGSADLAAVLFKECRGKNFKVCRLANWICIGEKIIDLIR